MQTIVTKYVGPGYVKGGRIIASIPALKGDKGTRITISYPDEARGGIEGAHFEAVKALCNRLGWHGQFTVGTLESGQFVWVPFRGEEELAIVYRKEPVKKHTIEDILRGRYTH